MGNDKALAATERLTVNHDTDSQPDLLWHYTNLSGLMGIIASQELWATDIRYLNDSTEFAYGRDQVLQVLREKEQIVKKSEPLVELAEMLEDTLKKRTVHNYVVCFSEHRDALSLWRGYGHQGYALGFDRKEIESRFQPRILSDLRQPHLTKLAYDQEEQVALIRTAIEEYRLTQKSTPEEVAGLGIHLYALIGELKHPAFKDECEVRLTFQRSDGVAADVRFRESALGPTPFISLPLLQPGHPEATPIRQVLVGPTPHPDEALEGVKQLLSLRGLINVNVEGSTVPLRW